MSVEMKLPLLGLQETLDPDILAVDKQSAILKYYFGLDSSREFMQNGFSKEKDLHIYQYTSLPPQRALTIVISFKEIYYENEMQVRCLTLTEGKISFIGDQIPADLTQRLRSRIQDLIQAEKALNPLLAPPAISIKHKVKISPTQIQQLRMIQPSLLSLSSQLGIDFSKHAVFQSLCKKLGLVRSKLEIGAQSVLFENPFEEKAPLFITSTLPALSSPAMEQGLSFDPLNDEVLQTYFIYVNGQALNLAPQEEHRQAILAACHPEYGAQVILQRWIAEKMGENYSKLTLCENPSVNFSSIVPVQGIAWRCQILMNYARADWETTGANKKIVIFSALLEYRFNLTSAGKNQLQAPICSIWTSEPIAKEAFETNAQEENYEQSFEALLNVFEYDDLKYNGEETERRRHAKALHLLQSSMRILGGEPLRALRLRLPWLEEPFSYKYTKANALFNILRSPELDVFFYLLRCQFYNLLKDLQAHCQVSKRKHALQTPFALYRQLEKVRNNWRDWQSNASNKDFFDRCSRLYSNYDTEGQLSFDRELRLLKRYQITRSLEWVSEEARPYLLAFAALGETEAFMGDLAQADAKPSTQQQEVASNIEPQLIIDNLQRLSVTPKAGSLAIAQFWYAVAVARWPKNKQDYPPLQAALLLLGEYRKNEQQAPFEPIFLTKVTPLFEKSYTVERLIPLSPGEILELQERKNKHFTRWHPLLPSPDEIKIVRERSKIFADALPAYYEITIEDEKIGILNWNLYAAATVGDNIVNYLRTERITHALARMVQQKPNLSLICFQNAQLIASPLDLDNLIAFFHKGQWEWRPHSGLIMLCKKAVFESIQFPSVKLVGGLDYMQMKASFKGKTITVLNTSLYPRDKLNSPESHEKLIKEVISKVNSNIDYRILVAEANINVRPTDENASRKHYWMTSGAMRDGNPVAMASNLCIYQKLGEKDLVQATEWTLDPLTGYLCLASLSLQPMANPPPESMRIFKRYLAFGEVDQIRLNKIRPLEPSYRISNTVFDLNREFAPFFEIVPAHTLAGEERINFDGLPPPGVGMALLFKKSCSCYAEFVRAMQDYFQIPRGTIRYFPPQEAIHYDSLPYVSSSVDEFGTVFNAAYNFIVGHEDLNTPSLKLLADQIGAAPQHIIFCKYISDSLEFGIRLNKLSDPDLGEPDFNQVRFFGGAYRPFAVGHESAYEAGQDLYQYVQAKPLLAETSIASSAPESDDEDAETGEPISSAVPPPSSVSRVPSVQRLEQLRDNLRAFSQRPEAKHDAFRSAPDTSFPVPVFSARSEAERLHSLLRTEPVNARIHLQTLRSLINQYAGNVDSAQALRTPILNYLKSPTELGLRELQHNDFQDKLTAYFNSSPTSIRPSMKGAISLTAKEALLLARLLEAYSLSPPER